MKPKETVENKRDQYEELWEIIVGEGRLSNDHQSLERVFPDGLLRVTTGLFSFAGQIVINFKTKNSLEVYVIGSKKWGEDQLLGVSIEVKRLPLPSGVNYVGPTQFKSRGEGMDQQLRRHLAEEVVTMVRNRIGGHSTK